MSALVRRAAVAGTALALAGSMAACGGSSGGSGSGSQKITSVCKLSSPPASNAKAPNATSPMGKAKGKVGVILPDTTSSIRYTNFDKPLLTKALTGAGLTADVQNAQGDKNKFASIAQSMIGEGVKVLIIDSIDAASGAGVEKLAAQAGVKVIDYDRINLGGSAGYYVTFDNQDIGRLQAQALVDCLDAQKIKKPKIIMMDGGTDVDNNAVLFKKGAHEVLDPLVKAGKLTIEQEAVVKGWKVENAAPAFSQALTASDGKVDGVYAANDDIANAVVGVLKNQGLDGHVILTGQDAGTEGLQNILTGKQSMTIYKSYKDEADATARLAIALASGKDPSKAGLQLSPFADPQKPSHKVQSLLLPAEVTIQSNVSDVVKAGQVTSADLCKGITSTCSKLGIS